MGETQSLTVDAERQRQLIDSFTVYCSTLSPEERELVNDPIRRARLVERCILSRAEKDVLYKYKGFDTDIPFHPEAVIKVTERKKVNAHEIGKCLEENPEIRIIKISEACADRVLSPPDNPLRSQFSNILFVINTEEQHYHDKRIPISLDNFNFNSHIQTDRLSPNVQTKIDPAITCSEIIETLFHKSYKLEYIIYLLGFHIGNTNDLLNYLSIEETERYRFLSFVNRNRKFESNENLEALNYQPMDANIIRKILAYIADRDEPESIHNYLLSTIIRVINGIAYLMGIKYEPHTYSGFTDKTNKFMDQLVKNTINMRCQFRYETQKRKESPKRSERWEAGMEIVSIARELWREQYPAKVLNLAKGTHVDARVILLILDLIFPTYYTPGVKILPYQLIERFISSIFPDKPIQSKQFIEQTIMRTVVKIAETISEDFPDETERIKKQLEIYKPRKNYKKTA